MLSLFTFCPIKSFTRISESIALRSKVVNSWTRRVFLIVRIFFSDKVQLLQKSNSLGEQGQYRSSVPLACLICRLNGMIPQMKLQNPASQATAGVARERSPYAMNAKQNLEQPLSNKWRLIHLKCEYLEPDVKQYGKNIKSCILKPSYQMLCVWWSSYEVISILLDLVVTWACYRGSKTHNLPCWNKHLLVPIFQKVA